MPATKHKITVKSEPDEEFEYVYDSRPFVARCSCGWESEKRSRAEWAGRSGAGHLADAPLPAGATEEE